MDDLRIHGTIEQLVAEEHELWEREAAGNATHDDRRRLQQIKISLDQSWDLLRQHARCVERAAIRMRLRFEHPTLWSAMSNSARLVVGE